MFIILAILIAIILVILFLNKDSFLVLLGRESPLNQVEKCIKESVKQGLDTIEAQGGSIEPKNYYLYEGNKVDYVCYTIEDYKKCVMQKPLLKQSIESELKIFLKPRVNDCLSFIEQSLVKKGYTVSYKNPEIYVEIIPNSVFVKSSADLVIQKEGSESYQDIKISMDSKLYDFVITAGSIANWEARYGDSETMNYMWYYPSLKVEKKIQDDGTRIYILSDRDTKEKFMFASRSMAFPPGLTGK